MYMYISHIPIYLYTSVGDSQSLDINAKVWTMITIHTLIPNITEYVNDYNNLNNDTIVICNSAHTNI